MSNDDDIVQDPGTAELDSIADWIEAYTKAKEVERIAKERAEEARSMIAAALDEAEAEIGTVNGTPRIRWRRIESSRVLTAKLRTAYPDLVDEYTLRSTAYRMDVL